jgi:hypothetical protein
VEDKLPFAWLARFLPCSSRVESAAAYDAGSEVAGVHGAVVVVVVVVVGHAEVAEAVLDVVVAVAVAVAIAVAIAIVVVIEPVRPAHDSTVRFSTLKVAR